MPLKEQKAVYWLRERNDHRANRKKTTARHRTELMQALKVAAELIEHKPAIITAVKVLNSPVHYHHQTQPSRVL